ncbi:MAG: alanine racemase [Chloroflexi bacterium]|nr:alanine racemase [Chloroflexota bacterium]
MWQGRPLWAEIDLDAIAHNVQELRRQLGVRTELLAVVKANGYGHGAIAVSQAVLEAGARRLGVACADEGVQLRRAGIQAPILIMSYTPVWEAEKVVTNGLTPTVSSQQLAFALARFSTQRGVVTSVHVKVETGMGRFGLSPEEVVPFAEFLRALPGLWVEGLYTHFAVADEADKGYTWRQYEIFTSVSRRLPWIPIRHVANSAAILDLPDMGLDMARPGISIYGSYPSHHVGRTVLLKPALSIKARLARLYELAPGDSVSYGRTWVATQPTRIALVPCGYADGLQRCLSNKGSVLIRGRRAPIVGRVCMDQSIADVTVIPEAEVDDEVVIIGRQGDEEITVEEVAAIADTISYEVFCGIGARVPRVYFKAGQVVHVQTLVEEKGYKEELEK